MDVDYFGSVAVMVSNFVWPLLILLVVHQESRPL